MRRFEIGSELVHVGLEVEPARAGCRARVHHGGAAGPCVLRPGSCGAIATGFWYVSIYLTLTYTPYSARTLRTVVRADMSGFVPSSAQLEFRKASDRT